MMTQPTLTLTPAAAQRTQALLISDKLTNGKLRVYIIGGGCNGFQYGFLLDEKIDPKDRLFVQHKVALVVDPISFQYLKGSTIDYVETLEGGRFTLDNPSATTRCSCGNSFSL